MHIHASAGRYRGGLEREVGSITIKAENLSDARGMADFYRALRNFGVGPVGGVDEKNMNEKYDAWLAACGVTRQVAP